MLDIRYTKDMKQDLKRMVKRGKNISKLEKVLSLLANGDELPLKYRNHKLTGNYSGHFECHIESDWFIDIQNIKRRIGLNCDRYRNAFGFVLGKKSRISPADRCANGIFIA